VEWALSRAHESIIDAIPSKDQGSLQVTCSFIFKTPIHSFRIRTQILDMEKARIENLRISALNVEGIAGLVSLFPEPEPLPAETRWLQLLKGTMNGLPLAEVVERYGVSIQAMERALRGCVKREEFKSASVESLVLHHLIHQRLGALCRLGDMCLGQPSEQQRRTEPVLQPAEGVAGLGAHGKAPAITATIKTPDPAIVPSSSGRSAVSQRQDFVVSGKLNHCCERSFSCMASCMGAR
jgi:hypothetical protein